MTTKPERSIRLQRIDRIKRVVVNLEIWLASILLLILLALLTFQVISRYVFSIPVPWTEEIARYTFVWVIFLGAAYVASDTKHLSVTLISDRLGEQAHRVLIRVVALITLATTGYVAYAGIAFVESTAPLASPGSGISMATVYVAGVVGMTLMTIHSLETIIWPEDPDKDAIPLEAAV